MDKYTTRDGSGVVDVAASSAAYGAALSAWVLQNELPVDRISAAVNAVFDRFPGQKLPMPFLLSLAVAELGAGPAEHKSLTERVHSFVRGQADEGGTLVIGKGKGGGITRK